MGESENGKKPHTLFLDGRGNLTLTGVEEVTGFDGEGAVLQTCGGTLTLEGEDLKVLRFDRESGDLAVSGRVRGLTYPDEMPGEKKKGLKRILR